MLLRWQVDSPALVCQRSTLNDVTAIGMANGGLVRLPCTKRALPLEAELESEIKKAEDILDHVENIAEEQDYEVETNVLQAREVGPAIVAEAVERGVDLILMGITYKRHFGQFSLGSVVPYVLKNAPCRVILYHESPS